jgi:flagellar hook-length control protein FliK
LERLVRPEANIRALLENTPPRPVTYGELLADAFLGSGLAKPGALKGLLESQPHTPLEDMELTPSPSPSPAAMARMQALAAAQPNLVHYLQSRSIAPSLPNIKAAERITRSKRALAEALEEAGIPAESLTGTELAPLQGGEGPSGIMARALARLEASEAPAVTEARAVLALQNSLNHSGGFTIPIKVNGRVSALQVHVLNEKALHEDGARVFLSLDTPSLGEVRGYFTVNGGTIDIDFAAEDAQALAALESRREGLNALLANAGITPGVINFSLSANENEKDTAEAPSPPERETSRESAHEYRI